eukprot:1751726-Heterocapsa_arctica.AAC.1
MPVCFLEADDLALQKAVEDSSSLDGGFCGMGVEQPPDVPADEVRASEGWQLGEAGTKLADGDAADERVPRDAGRG